MNKRCKYFEYCGQSMSSMIHIVKRGVCVECDMMMRKRFKIDSFMIRDTKHACSVCYEEKGREVEFPTKCGHFFCVECTKLLLEPDSTRHQLNPIYYGCPPCPVGCINPCKGKQCKCPEKKKVINEWKKEDPLEYIIWCKDSKFWKSHGPYQDKLEGIAFGSGRCPMCRKV